jgi:hypothetical protein
MSLLPLTGWSLPDYEIALRMLLAGVMSHGGETPALFAFYSDLLRAAKATPFNWR